MAKIGDMIDFNLDPKGLLIKELEGFQKVESKKASKAKEKPTKEMVLQEFVLSKVFEKFMSLMTVVNADKKNVEAKDTFDKVLAIYKENDNALKTTAKEDRSDLIMFMLRDLAVLSENERVHVDEYRLLAHDTAEFFTDLHDVFESEILKLL